jgi:hypothetical protein
MKGLIVYAVILVLVAALLFGLDNINRVDVDQAVTRFQEQAGTTDVVVIRNSNPICIIGDCHDVTFEMKIKGEMTQGRCVSGMFSKMVCRLYTGD